MPAVLREGPMLWYNWIMTYTEGNKMKKLCDLHTHSVFSDGTCTPGELIDAAVELGLSAVALCDHNNADGLPAFLAAAEGRDITAVCGTEFSVDYSGTELHLLGLFIPEEGFGQVTELMADVIRRKEESNIMLARSLSRAGYTIDYDELKSRSPGGKINRAHFAAELTRLGYTESVKDAFDKLLRPSAGHYVEPERLSVWKTIDFIRSIGAVPVLAHPFLNLSPEKLAEFLPRAKDAGLAGMECRYSLFDNDTAALALELAERFGLKPSGGSDFHGANKPDISLGSGRGGLEVPFEWAEALCEEGK